MKQQLIEFVHNPSGVACLVLVSIIVFFILKTYHDTRLINKAARNLDIPYRLIPFFHVDLLSLYKHQPVLKNMESPTSFRYFINLNDSTHYQCIKRKLNNLLEREEEYGEAFIPDHIHRI